MKTLRSAQVMLLVLTSNANNSDEIKKELVLAGRHHVTVVPVRVEDVVPNDAFTYEFATRQWIDLFKDWEHEIESLAAQVEHVLRAGKKREAGGAETVAPRHIVRPRRSRRPLVLGSALVAILIIVGGSFTTCGPFAPTSPVAPQTAMRAPASESAAVLTAALTSRQRKQPRKFRRPPRRQRCRRPRRHRNRPAPQP